MMITIIIIIVIGIFLGIAEYFVIETFSYKYDDKKMEDNNCRTGNSCFNRLRHEILNIIQYSKLNNRSYLPFVIVVTIILTLMSYFRFNLDIQFYKAFVLNFILIIISFIDIESQNIPNVAIIFTALAAILFILLGNISLVDSILGMLAGGGIMCLISLIPGSIGGGDVKLVFALGLFLGFKGILNAMMIAFCLASVVSLVLLLLKKLGRKDLIAFGPFLAVGTIIVVNYINK